MPIRKSTAIFNYLQDKFPGMGKQELKEMSHELSDIIKPQKKTHPLFTPFVEMVDKYSKQYNKEVIYTARTGKSINEIIEKLTSLVKKKNPDFKDSDVLDAWETVLQLLPEFYKESFDIITVNSKLDSIINSIRNAKRKSGLISNQAVDFYLSDITESSPK